MQNDMLVVKKENLKDGSQVKSRAVIWTSNIYKRELFNTGIPQSSPPTIMLLYLIKIRTEMKPINKGLSFTEKCQK